MSEPPSLPTPIGAISLTLLALALAVFGTAMLASEELGALALAIGMCVGFGGVGTIAARSVPAPADLRLGLRRLPPRFLLPIALMLPSVVLASELDNLVRPLFPAHPLPPEAEQALADPEVAQLANLELMITLLLLRPVLEEFFFRGVLQQGLVASLGPIAGVIQASILYAAASGGLFALFGPDRAASAAAQAAFLGLLYGVLRQTSGSLIAPLLAAVGYGIASLVLAQLVTIPGFNSAEHGHTPLWILAACAAPVGSGLVLAIRSGRGVPGVPRDAA